MVTRLLADLIGLLMLTVRRRRSIEAENLVLRGQLALFKERGVKPRRIDAATRLSLAWLSRLCDWRSCVIVVRPETIVRWHRAGWRLFWRYKSRTGRPPIPPELRSLIRRMAAENPLWGEERIANELLVKLGIRVSPRTVRRYMPKRPSGQPRGDQRWSTFLKNHAKAILACDFFVAVTATFRLLYVFVVIEHGTRRLAHVNVTAHPSADWTLQQLRAVVGEEGGHRYLIHDRDKIFAKHLDNSIRALGIEVSRSPVASPKANSICGCGLAMLRSLAGANPVQVTTSPLEESEVIANALEIFRRRPTLGFADCLMLEVARKAGHLPLGTFDRNLGKLDGAQRL
jgi:putative transposase